MSERMNWEEELAPVLRWHFAQRAARQCDREVDLARYAAADLALRERREFARHLDACPECCEDLARYAELQRDGELGEPREPWRWPRLDAWLRWPGPRGLQWAAAAALALFVVGILARPSHRDTLQIKGSADFQLHVAGEREGKVYRVQEGSKVDPGDRLGFFYSASSSGYLQVLYAGEQEVVVIVPSSGGGSVRIEAGREVRLPDGAVVSAGGGCEWFVGLFSRRPIGADEARDTVRRMVTGRSGCSLGEAHTPDVATWTVGVRQ